MSALAFTAAATFTGMAVLGLAACAQPEPSLGIAAPPSTSMAGAAPPTTQIAPPPVTVYVPPPVTVTVPEPANVPPKPAQTSCQWLRASGYSYTFAFQSWMDQGLPVSWDADHDGYPCEQSYGDQN